jgi:excisionase family DNA binding protein
MPRTSPFAPPAPLPRLPQGMDLFPPFDPTTEKLFTATEAGAYLHLQKRSIGKLITAGKLRAAFIGRSWMVPESSLRAFIDSQLQ